MSSSRTKCLSTRLTVAEYATLEQVAGAQTLSVWARAVLLDAAAAPPAEREVGARLSTPDRSDSPRADAHRDAPEGRRLGPPADDRAASRAHGPVCDPTSRIAWRPHSTDWSFRDPDCMGNRTLTRLSARFLAVLALACTSAGGIGAYRYVRLWTPLQRQYLASYVWSAVAISRSGSVRTPGDRRPGGAPNGARRGRRPGRADTGRRHVGPHGHVSEPWRRAPRVATRRVQPCRTACVPAEQNLSGSDAPRLGATTALGRPGGARGGPGACGRRHDRQGSPQACRARVEPSVEGLAPATGHSKTVIDNERRSTC